MILSYGLLFSAMAFTSGCCALAYEVLYMRVLTTILGDMVYVHAALLSTFLACIGIGSKLAHRLVKWLFLFEILTGAYALALPFITTYLSKHPSLILVTSNQFLTICVTIVFLMAPAILIGFSIPLFSVYIKRVTLQTASFQWTYQIYNLGALASILVVEFILIRHFGIRNSLAVFGTANIIIGIVLFLKRGGAVLQPLPKARIFNKRIIAALALGSIASAAFQLFSLKLFYLVFGPHRENFAVALSITFLGIYLGVVLVTRCRISFATILLLIPIVIAAIFINYLPILKITQSFWGQTGQDLLYILIVKFLCGCLFALGPMVLCGALIPALMRSEGEVAKESGDLLFISSMANAAGYLLYVFVFHPFFSIGVSLGLIAGISLAAGTVIMVSYRTKLQIAFAGSGVLLITIMVFNCEDRYYYLSHRIKDLKEEDRVLTYKYGSESATLLLGENYKSVSYNGHPGIYVEYDGIVNPAELFSGIIPALNAPRLEKALILGFGTGVTAGTAAGIFQSTDVVEINKAFYKMMPKLSRANLNIEANHSASLHPVDGRAFLIGKNRVYDVIVNSIPAPTYYSASKIYTHEFYERVKVALKPDGVFCTWLSPGDMSEEGIMTILSTLKHSFRYCELRLLRGNYYMASCSNVPVKSRKFSDLPVQSIVVDELERPLYGLDSDEFFDDLLLSDDLFANFTPSKKQKNTDNHPILELFLVRYYQMKKISFDPFFNYQAKFNIDPLRLYENLQPDRLARKGFIFYKFNNGYYKKNFLPILMKDKTKRDAWKKYLMEHVR